MVEKIFLNLKALYVQAQCLGIYVKGPQQANPQRQKVDSQLSGHGRREWGMTANRYGVFEGEDNENVLQLDSSDGCATL